MQFLNEEVKGWFGVGRLDRISVKLVVGYWYKRLLGDDTMREWEIIQKRIVISAFLVALVPSSLLLHCS